MKTSILISAIVACALSAPIVSAQEKPAPAKPEMSMDMDKHMSQMQESMLKMHEQMHKITDAKNPQERERLMREHRHMMHQHMQAMKDGGMMGGEAKSGSDTGAGKEQKDGEKHK